MSNFTALAIRRRARGALSLCVCLCVALACVWALASADVARAAPRQPASSAAQQAVQLDSPAVVRIVSVVNASLTCSGCASDGSDIHSPSDGGTFTYYSSGSGAFITPTGAILTADHVIDHSMANPDEVQFVEQQAAQDIAASGQYNATSAQALQYLTDHPSQVHITFNTEFQKAFLSTAYTGALPDTKHVYAFALAETVVSSPVNAQDIAIVRIDTGGISPAPDFPYLTLSDRPVNPLDNVTAIAFPADADLALNTSDFTALADVGSSDVNTINSLLSPSVNTGTITKANEVRTDGTLVYEASSIASNGSSGGPVINDNGEVIGFVDAGPSATDRLTFIIPSALVGKDLTNAGMASVPPGRFMPLWTAALAQYNGSGACHWTNAANDLTTLRKQYPTFGGVTPYLAQAKSNAASETCSATGGASTTGMTSDVMAGFALIGGCAVAIIALILGIIFLVIAMTRRKRRKPVPAPVATYAAPYPPTQAPQPSAAYPPVVMRPVSGARLCQNGHSVVEADAAFCPICGAPVQPGPARG